MTKITLLGELPQNAPEALAILPDGGEKYMSLGIYE